MRLTKGFTLIEMVIVILLIGIMSGIAIPRFEKRIELEELKSEKQLPNTIWNMLETIGSVKEGKLRINLTYSVSAPPGASSCTLSYKTGTDGDNPEKAVVIFLSNRDLIVCKLI